jgi:dephospho-CoA kinase
MLIAGLTGGIASGKSFVATELARLGCHVIEADVLGHAVLLPDGEAYEAVIEEFGTAILDAGDSIDRSALAAIVFSDAGKLARLNALVHPAVRERSRREFHAVAASDPHTIGIYAAAILIETEGYKELDKLIVAACPREKQIERALTRPGATEADVKARIERQMPLSKKLEFADYIIDTGGTKEETLSQTIMVFEDLRRLAS